MHSTLNLHAQPTATRIQAALGTGARLRYFKIWLFSDKDADGDHINALHLLFFSKFYPQLIPEGRVSIYVSPLIRARSAGRDYIFFTDKARDDWTPPGDVSQRYMKGLGSSSDKDIARDVARGLVFSNVVWDDAAEYSLTLHFAPSHVAERRKLVEDLYAGSQCPLAIEPLSSRTVTSYLECELVRYWFTDHRRALPGIDGLKLPLRKIIWSALHRWSTQT